MLPVCAAVLSGKIFVCTTQMCSMEAFTLYNISMDRQPSLDYFYTKGVQVLKEKPNPR